MTLRFRTLFWSGTAVLVIALIGWSFWPRPVLVDTARIERGALSVAIRDEGRTRIRDVYAIASPVSGRLLRIDWEPGDRIATGDVLARILPAEPSILDARSQGEAEAAIALAEAARSAARAEAGTARSALDLAREDHARIARLHETGIASQAQIDRAAAELRAAEAAAGRAQAAIRMREAEIEAARIHLHGSGAGDRDSAIFDIRSPIDGVVLQTVRESEGPVAAGAPLLEIGDPSGLEIVAEFLSADAVQTTPGDPAQITGWRRDAPPLPARVRRVEPYGFEQVSALGVEEQRVNVVLDFTGEPGDWSALGHGYRVETAITVWHSEDALRVPVAALFRQDGSWAVYRVDNNRAALTPVRIGQDNGVDAEVLDGLTAGDVVVLYPGEGVVDGAGVKDRGLAE
ncbi:MAG: HlyD family efflux transporter periplasmic adaptor subunit [Alphaproteobacteria bacterium]|uniref:efflux RND transporter periplasmic adaptor subunit n=1 Tax=Maricaulis alexandrii TaxID=2570354 RepID=UPI001109A5C8|nr:HlyD family efflux transporter periplasmic adaptor subunit [Maricaulis alexandrii]MCR9266536.1 HlyD family efflux transporter periplasmic adaptor subunit [Alphaproteobacteria bacterium]